jgi:hypothetical protein
MRLSAISVLLACASGVIPQTRAADTAAQKPPAVPRTQAQRQRLGRAAQSRSAAGSKASNVPPATILVTLQGVCRDRQPKGPCQTVITRETWTGI